MLSKRQRLLIQNLANQTEPISSNKLAILLSVSSKTIKRDVKDLNFIFPELVNSNEKGYFIDKSSASKILNENNKLIPESYEDRKTYILKKLLTSDSTSILSLSDELIISPTTLQNELIKIRNELEEYNLSLHIKKDLISISGSNKGKQKLLIELFNEELKDSFFSIEIIQNFFTKVNLSELKQIIINTLLENEYFLDDYSLTNYIFHVALLIENGITHSYHSDIELNKIFNNDLIQFCDTLYEQLNVKYKNKFTKKDFLDASFLMLTRIARIDYIPDKDINMLIDSNIIDLVSNIVKSVKLNFAIDLDIQDFVIPFTFHVKNLLIRLANDSQVVNLQFEQIKSQFPLLYSISVFITEKIEKYTNKHINEDEIAFIALHVGTVVEKRNIEEEKLKCIIIAPNYYALGEKITNLLKERFDSDLFIKDIVTSSEDAIFDDVDLCITTFSNSSTNLNSTMTINVSPFVTEDDLKKVFNSIEYLKAKKKKDLAINKLMYFLNKNLFFVNLDFKDKKDAITFLCSKLKKYNYVDDTFKEKIYQRENISSSAFGNVAIPHPLAYDGKSSIIAIVVSKNGIEWDKNYVNFIFMFSLNNQDHSKFTDVFDSITYLVKDKANQEKLLAVNSFDEFIELICSN